MRSDEKRIFESEDFKPVECKKQKEKTRIFFFLKKKKKKKKKRYSYELPFRNEQESSSELALEQMLRDAGDSTVLRKQDICFFF